MAESGRTFAVLGASGSVGRLIVAEAAQAGVAVRAQGRDAARLAGLPAEVHALPPLDAGALGGFVAGADAVIYALGLRQLRPTTFFSDTTRALIGAMDRSGVRRLVAITGVGAGETRGHGGFVYDRITFPLFTRRNYEDKDRQEVLIRASDLDWTIVRPAPFASRTLGDPMHVHVRVPPGLKLRRITRQEVAAFVVRAALERSYVRQAPFIGHP